MRVTRQTPVAPITPVAARPAAAAAAAAASTPAPLATTIASDVQLRMDGSGALAASGTVNLSRVFVERLLHHLTRKEKTFVSRELAYDPASKTYGGTLKLKVKGIPLNLVASAEPVIDQNQPGFRFTDVGLKLGPVTLRGGWITRLATKLIAKEISGDIKAEAGPNGLVRLEPTSLLREIGVLPASLRLSEDTRFRLEASPSGDLAVQLQAPGTPKASGLTDRSDLVMTAGAEALARVLKPALWPDYQLSKVTLGEDAITLDGKVEAKPISDVVNVGKGLLALIAVAGGRHPGTINADTEKVMIGLRLAVKLEGTQAVLTPSIRQAVGELEKTLKKAGIEPVREGHSLRFDLKALAARYGLEHLKVTPEGLAGTARLDIPSLLNSPILRGEAR